jgi:polysaccharide biosynthesis/export protein
MMSDKLFMSMEHVKCKIMMFALALIVTGCIAPMASQDMSLALNGSTFSRLGDYRIGPGDVLNLRVFGEDAVSGEYVVAPSGMIQLPLVGYVIAQGMSQVQLAQKLEQVLKSFVKDPKVAVSIASSGSFVVYFSGEVLTRGPRELKFRTNLLQGLVLAGGLTELSSGRIYLIRNTNEREVRRYSTTFKELLRGSNNLDFVYLERGDIVHAD